MKKLRLIVHRSSFFFESVKKERMKINKHLKIIKPKTNLSIYKKQTKVNQNFLIYSVSNVVGKFRAMVGGTKVLVVFVLNLLAKVICK